MKTVKIQLDVPGELSLAIDREILKVSSEGKKITKPEMAVKLINEGLKRSKRQDFATRENTITGDIKDLSSLKYIVLVTNSDQFPELNDVTWFENTQKGVMIEVNGVLYMNHPSSITDFVGEYAKKVEGSVFGMMRTIQDDTFKNELERVCKKYLSFDNNLTGDISPFPKEVIEALEHLKKYFKVD